MHSSTVRVVQCARVGPPGTERSQSTDWRWDLEEKLLLLCLLYGSFFTLNWKNLCRGHRIPASAPLLDSFLQPSVSIKHSAERSMQDMYCSFQSVFVVGQSIGTCSGCVCGDFGNVSCTARAPWSASAAWVVIRAGFARTSHKPSFYGPVIVFLSTITVITQFPYLPAALLLHLIDCIFLMEN